jgi:hypothetical protein
MGYCLKISFIAKKILSQTFEWSRRWRQGSCRRAWRNGGGGECLEAAPDVPVDACGRALERGGGPEVGCPPPALHLTFVVMDSQSISMDMVWRDDLQELAPFITNEDVKAAALWDVYGQLWLAQRDEAIWFSGLWQPLCTQRF